MNDPRNLPEMNATRDAAIRAMLFETVRQEPQRRVARKRRNWWIAGGITLAVAGVGTTAGGIVLVAQRASNSQYVFCLASDTRGVNGSFPGAVGASLASSDGRGRVEDAVELCSQMWLDGFFEQGYEPLATGNPAGRVPENFEVCVMEDGAAAVVPSDLTTVCNRLGMAPLKE
jgi:hypothetical protein